MSLSGFPIPLPPHSCPMTHVFVKLLEAFHLSWVFSIISSPFPCPTPHCSTHPMPHVPVKLLEVRGKTPVMWISPFHPTMVVVEVNSSQVLLLLFSSPSTHVASYHYFRDGVSLGTSSTGSMSCQFFNEEKLLTKTPSVTNLWYSLLPLNPSRKILIFFS